MGTDTLQAVGPSLARAETFSYDALDRLSCAAFTLTQSIDGGSIVLPPVAPEDACDLRVRYQPNGNIEAKSDVGKYAYDPARPHAVHAAGHSVFEYDAVGNQKRRPGMEIELRMSLLLEVASVPSLSCACGNRVPYGDIPCSNEWLFISDADFDAFSGQVDAEVVYRAMRSFLRCPACGRLWVFWNGYQDVAQEFVPGSLEGNKNRGSSEDG